MSKFLVTREWVKANASLVTMKESKNYPGLYVLKYKNCVFYDNLWTEELKQCRGTVVDKDFNVIVRPFDKIYNPHELNENHIFPSETVYFTRKVNGFMGAITYNKNYGFIVSTTGSLDSEYVELAKKYLPGKMENLIKLYEGYTFLFEICDTSDPHIIKEPEGAYLIGMVRIADGYHEPEEFLNTLGRMGFTRILAHTALYSEVCQFVKTVKHEGFVVRKMMDQSVKLKLKSPYYLYTKMVARMRSDKLLWNLGEDGYNLKQKVDEEFYPLIDYLVERKVEFTSLEEQDRIKFIEDYFNV